MTLEDARSHCLSLPKATEGMPFGDDTLVFKIGGKMFACLSLDEPDKLVVKCDAERAVSLREQRPEAIEPAFHFNKRYWNQLWMSQLTDDFIRQEIDSSYSLVVSKLTGKERAALGL